MTNFGLAQFGVRFLFAFVLVFATYNPTQYSYARWVESVFPNITAIIALCGILLLIGWFIFLRATLRSLGPIGLALCLAFFGCIIWLFFDLEWLSFDNISALSWSILMVISLLLSIGMSWSHIRRRMSGQVDTDDVEN